MLAAPQTTRFVLEMRAYVARRSWREELSSEQLIGLGAPAMKFAVRTLERIAQEGTQARSRYRRCDSGRSPRIAHRAQECPLLFRDVRLSGSKTAMQ